MNTRPRKFLMRAGVFPLPKESTHNILNNNLIGNNIGNLLFPYSICRTLLTEGTSIDTISSPAALSGHLIQKINTEYDAYLIPFANAFRKSFIQELKTITAFVKRLTIPCIVIGVGAQASLDRQPANRELDAAVTSFVKAVLEKSALLGLRGEFTAEYLKRLGFLPEKDFTVIGCPSLYLYGKELPELTKKDLTPESSVSVNSKMQLPQKFHDFMYRSIQNFQTCYYIPQVIQEIRHMYCQTPIPKGFVKKMPKHFLLNLTEVRHTNMQTAQDIPDVKGISFADVPSWLSFLSERDFSFGSRIHGNIAAILSGTPAYIIVSDERIRELVNYHHIPHLMMGELKKETDIFSLYEKADYLSMMKNHAQNYRHYEEFLHQNGLETIYDNPSEKTEIPFDHMLAEYQPLPPLTPYSLASASEKRNRRLENSLPAHVLRQASRKLHSNIRKSMYS